MLKERLAAPNSRRASFSPGPYSPIFRLARCDASKRYRVRASRPARNLLVLMLVSYVTKDQAETIVLFELIGARLRATLPADHRQPAARPVET